MRGKGWYLKSIFCNQKGHKSKIGGTGRKKNGGKKWHQRLPTSKTKFQTIVKDTSYRKKKYSKFSVTNTLIIKLELAPTISIISPKYDYT